MNEVPVRAPPMTESILKAMVGWSIQHDHLSFGLSLLVGFYSLLRTGELLSIQSWQVHMSSKTQPAVINLGYTKTGKRQGAAESVTLTEKHVLSLLWEWKGRASKHSFLTEKPHIWRSRFQECLGSLKLTPWGLRPYSLRRGGATHLFVRCGSLDRVLLTGRWTAVKTAKIYINSGLAMLADLEIPTKLLRPFHKTFSEFIQDRPLLEPSPSGRRTGGRGKVQKSRFKRN